MWGGYITEETMVVEVCCLCDIKKHYVTIYMS